MQIRFGLPRVSHFEFQTQPYITSLQTLTKVTDFESHAILHAHQNQAEIFYLEHGLCRFQTPNATGTLRDHTLALIGAQNQHSFQPRGTCQALCLHLGGLRLLGLPPAQFFAHHAFCTLSLKDTEAAPLLALLRSLHLFVEGLVDGEGMSECAASFARTLVLLALRRQKESKASMQRLIVGIAPRIKEYLDEHFMEDLRLENVAKSLHVSASYLSHCFKAFMGISPVAYIIQRRIEEAQRLLLTTEETVTNIAIECGFNDSNYFQSVFKREVGMTPGSYRKSWGRRGG